jgi:type VI secretion system protein ImpK
VQQTQVARPLTQIERIRAGLAPEIAAGEVEAVEAGTRIVIRVGSALLFDSGKADVRPQFRTHAVRIAAVLDKEPGPISVVGHTDNQPLRSNRFASNFELSKERANQVAAVMRPGLSDGSRLKTEGRGEQEPVVPNTTAENRAKNRRVEVWINRAD